MEGIRCFNDFFNSIKKIINKIINKEYDLAKYHFYSMKRYFLYMLLYITYVIGES